MTSEDAALTDFADAPTKPEPAIVKVDDDPSPRAALWATEDAKGRIQREHHRRAEGAIRRALNHVDSSFRDVDTALEGALHALDEGRPTDATECLAAASRRLRRERNAGPQPLQLVRGP